MTVCYSGCHGRDVTDLRREIRRHEVHVVGQIFPRPGHAFDFRLAAELSFRAHLPGHARYFRGKSAKLLHHCIYGLGRTQELAFQRLSFNLTSHRLGQISLSDCTDDARHFARRTKQILDQNVDASNGVAPGL